MSELIRSVETQSEVARALLANLSDVIGEDQELAAATVEGETSLFEAIAGAVDRIAELDIFERVLAEKMKELAERKERFSAQAARIRAAVHVALASANQRSLQLASATVSIRAVPPVVDVTEESAIPADYFRQAEPKLDKLKLLRALKDGEVVPGARLSQPSETLGIRWK